MLFVPTSSCAFGLHSVICFTPNRFIGGYLNSVLRNVVWDDNTDIAPERLYSDSVLV